MEKITVLLSHPQVIFREGMHYILLDEDDFEVIGETTSNKDAVASIEERQPGIAVLSMTDIIGKRDSVSDGPDVTSYIKKVFPLVSVVLVMDNADREQLFSAVKSGASACLTKDTDPQYFLDVLRQIAQGSQPIIEALLIPELAEKVLAEFEKSSELGKQHKNMILLLCSPETEILELAIQGKDITQIATSLDISQEDVKRGLRLTVNKLVANHRARNIIEASGEHSPSIVIDTVHREKPATEYTAQDDFKDSKEKLIERLKSITCELAEHNSRAAAPK